MCDICVFKLCHPSFFKNNPQILDIISKIEDDVLFCFVLSYVYLVTFLYRVCYYHYSRN